MDEKLEGLARRFDELTAQMGDPGIYEIPGAFQDIAKEAAKLEPVVKAYRKLSSVREELAGAKEMLGEVVDPEMIAMVQSEISDCTIAIISGSTTSPSISLAPANSSRTLDNLR